MPDLTFTVTIPEAAVPALQELAGGPDADATAWLGDYVRGKLAEQMLLDARAAAQGDYEVAMTAARLAANATLDAALTQAQTLIDTAMGAAQVDPVPADAAKS